MTGPRILVVDDEPQIQRFLKPALLSVDYEVIQSGTAAEAKRLAATQAPDLVVLDLGLPDGDGKDVITAIRAFSAVPIIVLSARDRETEKIEALDRGADDYVEKPFGIGELLARIRTALRHRDGASAPAETQFRFGPVEIDLIRRRIARNGEPVHLTPKEYDLLVLLATNAGRVLTHRQLLAQVWGPAHVEDVQYLRVLVGQLRAKLEADPAQPRLVTNEPGVGYRLIPD
ncbi:transcriptional regulator [Devosia limi DSM 17137]|uniref:Transcriptional regulator n=1 Tax=Devosia limi DSM 17137 TaxID=1121477 RepID=A0A0F5LCI4_9HYPH|nr:response regulator [Devosia limi]KKB79337.1 transcriptional regulator [Devosia limi DSM 17137]SHF29851.1 two-component system, OmpR family, KDP operon response regulator KdpE [Devosia limi DSM 17137]